MAEYDETTYGERIAEVYDLFYGRRDNPETVTDFLAPLAGKRRALELGIGTGRIAISLAARGVRVMGIDASPAMVAKMHDKPGGADIPVVMGNFADVKVSGGFGLVYIVFSTLFALRNQDEQLRCFQLAAKRILPAGAFVVEVFNPDHSILAQRQRVTAAGGGTGHPRAEFATHDVVYPTVLAPHILFTARGRHR